MAEDRIGTGGRLRMIAARHQGNTAVIGGAIASAVWVVLVVLFMLLGPDQAGRSGAQRLMSVVGLVLPLAMIWMAVWFAQSLAALRDEAANLRDLLGHMRRQSADTSDVSPGEPRRDSGTRAVDPAPMPRAQQAAMRPAAPARPAMAPRPPAPRPVDNRQASLGLDPPPPPELTPTELVLSLNFPDGPDDREAIRSLRLALADPEMARLIRAAQDVVTLLAGQGAYMDELTLEQGDAALWRRFAEGERGDSMRGLAAVEDERVLDIAGNMIRNDEVFRDVAHHFLRHFDRVMASAAQIYGDDMLAALAETRSGRAFTLLAQVSGMFGRG